MAPANAPAAAAAAATSDVGLDKWLCVTLILAAEATVKLPKIRGLQVSLATANSTAAVSSYDRNARCPQRPSPCPTHLNATVTSSAVQNREVD
jgi:hypothetical protein